VRADPDYPFSGAHKGSRVPNPAAGKVHYFYDEDGNVIVERDQSGATLKDYVYMGGQHVAEFSGGQTYFVHANHLGSTRTQPRPSVTSEPRLAPSVRAAFP
jgi:hypothetical protein